MKKKSSSRIANVFSRIINIRLWFDWDRTKSFSIALKNAIRSVFILDKAKESKSFDSIASQMHLNENDLLLKKNALFRLSIIMLAMACFILLYSGYQLFYGSIKAFVVGLSVTMIAFALAFRYHFWYFQIKHRKLGCSFKEWYRQGFLGEKDE